MTKRNILGWENLEWNDGNGEAIRWPEIFSRRYALRNQSLSLFKKYLVSPVIGKVCVKSWVAYFMVVLSSLVVTPFRS